MSLILFALLGCSNGDLSKGCAPYLSFTVALEEGDTDTWPREGSLGVEFDTWPGEGPPPEPDSALLLLADGTAIGWRYDGL